MMNDYLTIENGVVIDCNTDATDVVIPEGVTSIGDRAFEHCTNVMIQCDRNSYAEEYAKENYIPYKIID